MQASGTSAPLPRLLRRTAGREEARLRDTAILTLLHGRRRPFSASELQGYLDCPHLWFAAHCLRVGSVPEEFGPLDRGQILHGVLEQFYRDRQRYPGQPVHLEDFTLQELWPEVESTLQERLAREPRFANRAQFLREIEWESLQRMMRRFLANEILRAGRRQTHPAFFEQRFGSGHFDQLWLGGHAISLQGVIDRIDVLDDEPTQAVVVDYKSSAAMTLRELEAGKVLQAPIYALAAARVFNLAALGVEFMGLKQAEALGIYQQQAGGYYANHKGMKLLPEEAWQELLQRAETRLLAAAQAIAAGEIAPAPTTTRCPLHCEYLALCRGERYALERMVRESGEEEEE